MLTWHRGFRHSQAPLCLLSSLVSSVPLPSVGMAPNVIVGWPFFWVTTTGKEIFQ